MLCGQHSGSRGLQTLAKGSNGNPGVRRFHHFFLTVTGENKTLPRVSMGLYAPWSILQIFQDTRKHRLRGLLENRSFLFSFYFVSLSHNVLNMAHDPVKVLLRPGFLALGGVLNDSLAGAGQYFVCLL
jgi:hypothetical protein